MLNVGGRTVRRSDSRKVGKVATGGKSMVGQSEGRKVGKAEADSGQSDSQEVGMRQWSRVGCKRGASEGGTEEEGSDLGSGWI